MFIVADFYAIQRKVTQRNETHKISLKRTKENILCTHLIQFKRRYKIRNTVDKEMCT